jgi:hypothetical protein
MLQRFVLGVVMLMWISVAILLVGITAFTGSRWNAETGYLLAAATVAGAWAATHALLRLARVRIPYQPSEV